MEQDGVLMYEDKDVGPKPPLCDPKNTCNYKRVTHNFISTQSPHRPYCYGSSSAFAGAFPKDNPGPGPPLDITAPSFRAVHDKAYMLPHESPRGDGLGKFESEDRLEVSIIMGWAIVTQGTFSFSQFLRFCMLFLVFLFGYLIHFNQSVYLIPCPLINPTVHRIEHIFGHRHRHHRRNSTITTLWIPLTIIHVYVHRN